MASPLIAPPLAAALLHGDIALQGQFVYGSNYTFLVTVTHRGEAFPAVYKPMRGEQPLWDFRPASLAGREVAAYLLSEALGFGFVPLTVLRDGPYGPGSLQQFIDHNPERHYFSFKPAERLLLRPVVLFDLLANNADRKGGHVLFQKGTRRLFAIDHGLCFHAEDKLRTVIWDFAGQPIPPDLQSALGALQPRLPELTPALAEYLLPQELAALSDRLAALLADPVFPLPPEDRRAFPYPPL
jgi:hypothetical protein